MRAALARLTALAATMLLASFAVSCASKASAPPDATPPDDTESYTIFPEEGNGDIALKGYMFGPSNSPLVILTHMRPNDQTAWFPFAEQLATEGYAAFTFDFRGHGESTGSEDFATLDDDLTAVITYLRDRGRTDIFLVGASMGATTSLVVAETDDAKAVVAISPPSDFEGQDALAAVPSLTAPKLFVASELDAPTLLFDQLYDAAAEPKEKEIYPGNLHGTDLLDPEKNEQASQVEARILRFLDEQR